MPIFPTTSSNRCLDYVKGRASFDATGVYRYTLLREWSAGPRLGMVLLNPSTADAERNDPTVRRCIGYAMDWGFGSLEVVNLFALRSTDPSALRTHPSPQGPLNTRAIVRCADRSDLIVTAWGNHGRVLEQEARILRALRRYTLHHLGLTSAGCPRHPLYLPKSLEPEPWHADSD